MYWMHKFTKQQEQTEKGREPFPSAITALLPELVFVMSYSEPSDDQGNWSGRTKMLNSIQEVIAELNAAAASCDLIIHSLLCILEQWELCVPKCGSGELACAPRTAMHRRRGVLFRIARKRHGACDRLGAHAVSPLVFQCFLTIHSSSSVRVLGGDRHARTCAASRGPPPSGRVVPWNGPPPRAPGMARGARIRPRKVDFPLVFKGIYSVQGTE